MWLGFTSQQPPSKEAPWLAVDSTKFLKTLGVKFSTVPRTSVGCEDDFELITKSSGMSLNAFTLKPYVIFCFLNSGKTSFAISGETQAAIIPQQL